MDVADEVQLVAFRLGGHEFAFNVFEVERVLRYEHPNPLPQAPPYLLGTVRYGDEVIPVVDLRKRLETVASVEENTRIAIVKLEQGKLGVVVDAVLEVLKTTVDRISPPPPSSGDLQPSVSVVL
jgi:purine-binding chemotaxis protein CheW